MCREWNGKDIRQLSRCLPPVPTLGTLASHLPFSIHSSSSITWEEQRWCPSGTHCCAGLMSRLSWLGVPLSFLALSESVLWTRENDVPRTVFAKVKSRDRNPSFSTPCCCWGLKLEGFYQLPNNTRREVLLFKTTNEYVCWCLITNSSQMSKTLLWPGRYTVTYKIDKQMIDKQMI